MKHAVAGALLVVGCGKVNPAVDAMIDAPVMPNVALTEVLLLPTTVNRDLDVLFVIDDSPTMLDKQTNLKNSFAPFVSTLSAGGLPNLHLAVVSTDVGTAGTDEPPLTTPIGSGPGSCNGVGDNGNFNTNGTTLLTSGNFITTSPPNYTGTIEAAFNAIATVGASGCGFEQPLHSMYRALNNNPQNAGFLRPTARLGIIFLADEDDCSIKTPSMLTTDTTTLGPLQSFRCTRFGVQCDMGGTTPDEMNQVGTKGNCHSNESSTYVADIARFTAFARGLKPDAREIVVGAIIGKTTPVATELRAPPGGVEIPALARSCMYTGANGEEVADPGVRLAQFATSMPQNLVASVCDASGSLTAPMTQLATRLKPLVGDACLQREIVLPSSCEAFDLVGETLVPLPECNANKTPPCFELVPDAALCPAGNQHLRVSILRDAPTDASWTSVRCLL